MTTFRELFATILTGDKAASRAAARQVRPLVYGGRESGKREELVSILREAPATYTTISDPFRQENFVIAISVMYFLHDREKQPDFLYPWFFHLLQHDNGNIRHAVVRMIGNDLGPLTYHLRCPGGDSSFSRISPAGADQILFGLRLNLQNLAAGSYKPAFKKYKYIDSLPSCTYKSVNVLLSQLEDYTKHTNKPLDAQTVGDIQKRRSAIEQRLLELITATGSAVTVEHIKKLIYNEQGAGQLRELITIFETGTTTVDITEILEVINDSWNYFPHKLLGGLSPAEKILEFGL